jgi:hypothetical protein
MPLVRRLNDRLERLERELADRSDAAFLDAISRALEPVDDAPPVGEIFPIEGARVPGIHELAVELGAPSWTISHEIAILPGPNIYRVSIELVANPLSDQPVRVLGIDS